MSIAADLCLYLVGSDQELTPYMQLLRIRTKNLIKLNWTQIEAVAEALLARMELNYEEVREIWLRSMGVDPDIFKVRLLTRASRQTPAVANASSPV